jgi:hypothetical protein
MNVYRKPDAKAIFAFSQGLLRLTVVGGVR